MQIKTTKLSIIFEKPDFDKYSCGINKDSSCMDGFTCIMLVDCMCGE